MKLKDIIEIEKHFAKNKKTPCDIVEALEEVRYSESKGKDIKVGDYVFCTYRISNFIHKVIEIEPKFVTNIDINRYPDVYGKLNAGDEIAPSILIEKTFDLSPNHLLSKKKVNMERWIHASFLIKVKQEMITKHMKRLSDALEIISVNQP